MNGKVEKVGAGDASAASFGLSGVAKAVLGVRGRYDVEFFDADGKLVWHEVVENLVTTAGRNHMLDTELAGSAYTAAWYLGLVNGASSPTFDVADTAASHSGWTEFASYSNSTRPAPGWNAASAGSKATTQTTFDITANGTVAGCFLISNSTKSGNTGTLFSCGAFSGGSQPVTSGGQLRVTYTAQLVTP